MPQVFIPPLLRPFSNGRDQVGVAGDTVAEVIRQLDQQFPGIAQRLCEGDDLRPGLSVVVDDKISSLGLMQRVDPQSEVHFLPAISGG